MNLFDRLIVLDMVTINLVYFGLALFFFKVDFVCTFIVHIEKFKKTGT